MKTLFYWSRMIACILLFPLTVVHGEPVSQEWIETNYQKQEFMIPMRDGIALYTAVYTPKAATNSPILIMRTPYSCGNYGDRFEKIGNNYMRTYLERGYIYVKQDVRGRYRSEGIFEHIKPLYSKQSKTKTDEATDVYDTVEWLLAHLSNHNGSVGILGNSYSGFYAFLGGLSGHPAIKAISPQAPVVDWFIGDDFHQNGAFKLIDAFHFHNSFGKPHYGPTERYPATVNHYTTDEYSFFLQKGSLQQISSLLGDSIFFWPEMMEHIHYDAWWQARNPIRYCRDLKTPTLIAGGFYDAEDAYGAFTLYRTLAQEAPETPLFLAAGPWAHGQWRRSNADKLGNLTFGENTARWFQDSIEVPFFEYYLRGKGETLRLPAASVFVSGSNRKHAFDSWPPCALSSQTFYLQSGKMLSQTPSTTVTKNTYLSDPASPVPYTDRIASRRVAEYMTADQRFASRRPDVLTYRSEPLSEAITVTGQIQIDLGVMISTTDADFVVKIIDEYPDPAGEKVEMSGYQLLVRGEVMRGRYRDSFSAPKPFRPAKADRVCWNTVDVAHTFRKGHRILVQVQSSWFPLIDRNPQQFVDIYRCTPADFVPAQITVLEGGENGSKITMPCFGER